MIIVRLFGGLGNQLFQYAAGKSLAMHQGTTVKLDTSLLGILAKRPFDLQYFNIPIDLATEEEIREYTAMPAWQKLLPPYKRKIYKEPHFHYDTNFFKARPNVYLKGYWQSEKYFKHIEAEIRKEFTVKEEYIRHLPPLAHEPSLFIHIRRSDYLKKEVQDYHGTMDADYYNKALEYVSKKAPNLKVYFFSDDIEWVKQNIKIDHPYEMVTGNLTHTAIEDFYLMSRCQHAIIANSSFSWWAAWLNNHPAKIVVAPGRWFINTKLNTKDIIPPNWTLIP
jgi:Glycosyl transferase family 11.